VPLRLYVAALTFFAVGWLLVGRGHCPCGSGVEETMRFFTAFILTRIAGALLVASVLTAPFLVTARSWRRMMIELSFAVLTTAIVATLVRPVTG
jgi:hypothetical protein